jgi:hypothetical protein
LKKTSELRRVDAQDTDVNVTVFSPPSTDVEFQCVSSADEPPELGCCKGTDGLGDAQRHPLFVTDHSSTLPDAYPLRYTNPPMAG